MNRPFQSRKVFAAIVTCVLVMIVVYMSQENEILILRAPQRETRNECSIPTSVVKANCTKTRLNVIILTHRSSGSTLVGNIFNLHPDVFYIYEPLNTLRRDINKNEWRALEKPSNDAYRQHFTTLLRDLFTCGFEEERTIELAFPDSFSSPEPVVSWSRGRETRGRLQIKPSGSGDKNVPAWARPFNAWDNRSTPLTKETLRKACNARKITGTKIMQTRLPREGGIHELEQVSRSDPSTFDCFIVHQVRDPRAVLSSLISKRFYSLEPAADLFTQTPDVPRRNKTSEGKCANVMHARVRKLRLRSSRMVKLVQKPLHSGPLRRHYQQHFKRSVRYIQIL